MNEYINLTLENIDEEHICCAIGDKKHQAGVDSKKEWIKSKLKDGHIFRKLNARGKIFIEYEPIETAWIPISGKNYEYIYCLWVAGSFKGKGIGKELLEYAINDSKGKGKSGICTLVSKKKKPFIGEKKFFEHYGFKVVDTIGDYELLALQFDDSETPRFNDNARTMKIDNQDFTIYYSNECPYVEYEVNELSNYAKENNIKINFIKIDSLEKAKIVVLEMAEQIAFDLFEQKLVSKQFVLTIGYDRDNLQGQKYSGEVAIDRYGRKIPKHAHGTINLDIPTSSLKEITTAVSSLYDRIIDKELLIRRLTLSATKVMPKEGQVYQQLDLFTDYEALKKEQEKERRLQKSILDIKKKYGKNAVLRGLSYEEGATTRTRNGQIGGHKA